MNEMKSVPIVLKSGNLSLLETSGPVMVCNGFALPYQVDEMPFLNMPVQRLKVAILPLDGPCSGPITHSGEI
jgi:hypothetical protein